MMPNLTNKARSIISKVGRAFQGESEQSKRVRPWKKANGEQLRFAYPLTESSVVMDLGGYEGQWASDIFSRYCCSVMVFEPVREFSDQIAKRFAANRKISSFPFGLSGATGTVEISLDKNSSSAFKDTGNKENKESVRMVRASDFFSEHEIGAVDLMKINIEGGEYELLEHLIESGLVRKIRNIQVQFHDFVPNAQARMEKIQRELAKTHHTTYQYPFVWENWELNS